MPFAPSDMELTSTAFRHGGAIPRKHTGAGENVSPSLAWTTPPDSTKSFAVICHDPDAPLVRDGTYGWVHWVLYNLPASTTSLDEGGTAGTAGAHDGGGNGYNGPMPPEGHGTHHYFFWILALGRELDLEPGLTLWEFLAEAEPHVLGMSRTMGTFER